MIAPSHGNIYDQPEFITRAWKEWVLGRPKNLVVLPYVSMRGSTGEMVDHFVSVLVDKGVRVQPYDLTVTDIGKLAIDLVDAGTIVVGSSTVLAGPHPLAVYGTFLANALRPGAKFVSIIGSYGWGGKTVETLAGMIPNIKAEVLEPVLCKGRPKQDTFKALEALAGTIAEKHKEQGFE